MQSCRPQQYINGDQQIKSISGAAVYYQRGISTAISRAKAYLVQMHVTSAVELHTTASKWKAKALLDDTVMSTRAVSTAISKEKTYLAQLYINRDQQSESISELYINSNRNLKRKHFWTT